MTDQTEIVEEVRKSVSEIRESVQTEIKRLSDQGQQLKQAIDDVAAKGVGMRGPIGGGVERKTLKSTITAAGDQLRAMAGREVNRVSIPAEFTVKAIVGDAGQTGDDPYNVHPQRDGGLYNNPRRRLSLLTELPSIPVTSNSFEFTRLDGYTNQAGEQSGEGGTKAETAMPTGLIEAKIATVAHWIPASRQVLDDVPALMQQIDSLMRYGVLDKAEQLLVAGDAQVEGLEELGTAFSGSTGQTLADAVGDAIAELETEGWRPSHVLMHPRTWQSIRSERSSGDGQYVAAGWNQPAGSGIWELPVITSASVTENRPVVFDASQCALLDRSSVVVEVFEQDADNVKRNLVTIRGEMRIGLAVFSPSAIKLVTAL